MLSVISTVAFFAFSVLFFAGVIAFCSWFYGRIFAASQSTTQWSTLGMLLFVVVGFIWGQIVRATASFPYLPKTLFGQSLLIEQSTNAFDFYGSSQLIVNTPLIALLWAALLLLIAVLFMTIGVCSASK
ncbi:hypothetical protein FWH09_00770 [Candidatus Saccharibacteria bacterium]|nr:hypothetical protein [Candidatus Saccharibacteria bacterium]